MGKAKKEVVRDFVIRRAQINDVVALAKMFDEYRQFYGRRPGVKEAAKFLRLRIQKSESVIFLAQKDKEAIGFVQLYPSFSSISLKRLWILNDLYVVQAARRMGIAAALMERTVKLARGTFAKGLCLETAISNIPAQNLYERLGWERDETFFRYSFDLSERARSN